MATGKAPKREPRVAPKKSDSSRRRRDTRTGAEESRRFGALAPEQTVIGAVKGWRVPRRALRAVLAAYLDALGLPKAGVTLQLVDDAACRELNRRFRGKDAATDVLSFPALSGRAPSGFDGYLGDLALSLPYAWAKRGRFDPDFGGEAAFLILHGLLHLCGQHHDSTAQERAMWKLSRLHHQRYRPYQAGLRALRPLKKTQ